MKNFYFITICFFTLNLTAQITLPVIKANFGVDGELKANYFNNFGQSGNDDWFNMNAGTGQFVIDTTGAAAIVAGYISNPATLNLPFYRTMRYPAYTVVNNKLLIDAVFIRDYHGQDSTMFASGSNKNGMSPADWSCPVAQSVPDKNEILDMMVHVRRAGPNATDSLWLFGGVSIENTSGSRYIDFEMYQTDIYYDRSTLKFYGYGPNAGHTIWQFDGAGDIIVPGDVIFSAQYNTGLDSLEARIWVDKASLSMTPQAFDWAGTFDGASSGSQYGYAGIKPKTAGAFYTGLTSVNNTWAGPFQLVVGNNTVYPTYTATQFMEFSVNLSKIGLDPVTLLGGNSCGMPFRRVLVKSRASNAFTSSLKDFVGPFDFFLTPRVKAYADIPLFCGVYGVSNLKVSNPVSTSVYNWSTTDGHISGDSTGTSIYVDSPGTYVVSHRLQVGCPVYATDTVKVAYDLKCAVLETNLISLAGILNKNKQSVKLNWRVLNNQEISYFQIERSTDGLHFKSAGNPQPGISQIGTVDYSSVDDIGFISSRYVFYRLKMVSAEGKGSYSNVIKIKVSSEIQSGISLTPNPVKDKLSVTLSSAEDNTIQLLMYDFTGKLIRSMTTEVKSGKSIIDLNDLEKLERGIYAVKVLMGKKVFVERFVLTK
jgi:hypothetical protein